MQEVKNHETASELVADMLRHCDLGMGVEAGPWAEQVPLDRARGRVLDEDLYLVVDDSTGDCVEVSASSGDVLTPELAARLALGGLFSAPVVRKPKVALVTVGEAGCPQGRRRPPRTAEDEADYLLASGKVEGWGGVLLTFDTLPDDQSAVEDAFFLAVDMADVTILCDCSKEGLRDSGAALLALNGDLAGVSEEAAGGVCCARVQGKPVLGVSGRLHRSPGVLDTYLHPVLSAFLRLRSEDDVAGAAGEQASSPKGSRGSDS